jgi:hypothetical protein
LDGEVAVRQDEPVDAGRRGKYADFSCEQVIRDLAVVRSDAPYGVIVETERAGVGSERDHISRGPGVGVRRLRRQIQHVTSECPPRANVGPERLPNHPRFLVVSIALPERHDHFFPPVTKRTRRPSHQPWARAAWRRYSSSRSDWENLRAAGAFGFLPDRLITKLRRFWAWKKRRGESLDPEAPLFANQSGRRLSKRRIQHAWAAWQRRAGFDRIHGFHALRHSAVTNVYRASRDAFLAERFASHENA